MLTLLLSNHAPRIIQASSATPPNIREIIGTSIGIAGGILGLIALVVFIWDDYKGNKEIDALLIKNGIKPTR